jgi:hypothetical protein
MSIDSVYKIIHIIYIGCCSESMIPDGKDVSVVTIRMRQDIMMMDLMKMWGDKNIGKGFIYG